MNEKERKALMEKRATLIDEMNELTEGIAKENRAFSDEEQKEFDGRRDETGKRRPHGGRNALDRSWLGRRSRL